MPVLAFGSLVAAVGLVAGWAAPPMAVGPAPTSHLVSWWPLDGDGADAVGPNHADALGTLPAMDRHGHAGGALAFDGVASFLHVARPRGLDVDLRTDGYAIALWVRGTSVPVSRLVQKWDEQASAGYAYSLQTTADGLDGVIYDPPTTHIVHVPGLWDGAWRHVTIQYDPAAGILSAWRGGVLVDARSVRVRRPTRSAAPVWFGRAPEPVTHRFFRGDLDDVRFYRRPLQEADIQRLARQ